MTSMAQTSMLKVLLQLPFDSYFSDLLSLKIPHLSTSDLPFNTTPVESVNDLGKFTTHPDDDEKRDLSRIRRGGGAASAAVGAKTKVMNGIKQKATTTPTKLQEKEKKEKQNQK